MTHDSFAIWFARGRRNENMIRELMTNSNMCMCCCMKHIPPGMKNISSYMRYLHAHTNEMKL